MLIKNISKSFHEEEIFWIMNQNENKDEEEENENNNDNNIEEIEDSLDDESINIILSSALTIQSPYNNCPSSL